VKAAPKFAPAGQSTQLIVGADKESDGTVLGMADTLYHSYRLRRVYYSAFSPIQSAATSLPNRSPPLLREHRLYQADWLLRFYGFSLGELRTAMPGDQLDLEVDPKTMWALQHRAQFPVDVNRASRENLLRVPGFGVRSVNRIITSRRHRRLRLEDLARLGCALKRARHFITTADPTGSTTDASAATLRALLVQKAVPAQQVLF
jgi:predicted DNA-binding helix-hairpin-helix protein